jgi:sterol desaturase/sphingolipid hydroxylase (fatty acid hydroxylase superfamily)
MIIWFLAGCFTWTFVEYAMHHWNGHLTKGRTHFSREHLRHHAVKDYFTPTSRKLVIAMSVTVGVTALGTPIIGWMGSLSLALGLVSGYGVYEYVHWANHVRAPLTPYGRWARRHHFSHHFTDARYNHGVTTPLWDLVFGTYRKPAKIKVPSKLAMAWLLDEEGDFKTSFGRDYHLRGSPINTGRVIVSKPVVGIGG